MSSLKNIILRMPLLFIIDSVLKGSFLDFTQLPGRSFFDIGTADKSNFNESSSMTLDESSDLSLSLHSIVFDAFLLFIWWAFQNAVLLASLVVLFSPEAKVKQFYRCLTGFSTLLLAYKYSSENCSLNQLSESGLAPLLAYAFAPIILGVVFDYVTAGIVIKKLFGAYNAYETKIKAVFICLVVSMSFRLIVCDYSIVSSVSWILFAGPVIVQIVQCYWMICDIQRQVLFSYAHARIQLQEVGFEMFCMSVIEDFNLSLLLRAFFFLRLGYHTIISKTLSEFMAFEDGEPGGVANMYNALILEMLHEMCGTLLAVVSLSSLVCVVSGWSMQLIYRLMGAPEGEEETVQPAVSGFMFVLLAMQTGMTSATAYYRLQLLMQNCILLVVANQHFVQGVAADLMLKASSEDVPLTKHIRPMLPYLIIFTFPFTVVIRLWDYPFRLSWLLAISAFTIELLIKSVTTLILYVLNMIHYRTNYLQENLDNILFYVKGLCGCLEFICGVFLFFNCAYIFIFESGGLIRLAMMAIHFYSNIYRAAIKGWTSFKLYRSAWVKVSKLRVASQEELDANDDICPICYQELAEAVVIQCSHVFHKSCLLKWLYIQEKCPLCHATL